MSHGNASRHSYARPGNDLAQRTRTATFHAKRQSDHAVLDGGPGPFDLGSANGERRAEPPRREGRRLPAALRAGRLQRREFHEALLEAGSFEDLPGKWQAAILEAEQNRPKLRLVTSDYRRQ